MNRRKNTAVMSENNSMKIVYKFIFISKTIVLWKAMTNT